MVMPLGTRESAALHISEEDLILLRGSSTFDEKWYSREYRGRRWWKFNAAYHFLSTGWQIGNQPSAGLKFHFDPRDYLAVRPDVAELGVHPVAHYLACGINERPAAGQAFPSDTAITKLIEYQSHDARSRAELRIEADLTRPSPLFDPKWYIERYPEALADGFDPRAHFLRSFTFLLLCMVFGQLARCSVIRGQSARSLPAPRPLRRPVASPLLRR
jgi:hypothetical protein